MATLTARQLVLGILAVIVVLIVILKYPLISKSISGILGYDPFEDKSLTTREYTEISESELKNESLHRFLDGINECRNSDIENCYCELDLSYLRNDLLIRINGSNAYIGSGRIALIPDTDIKYSPNEIEEQIRFIGERIESPFPESEFYSHKDINPVIAQSRFAFSAAGISSELIEKLESIYLTESRFYGISKPANDGRIIVYGFANPKFYKKSSSEIIFVPQTYYEYDTSIVGSKTNIISKCPEPQKSQKKKPVALGSKAKQNI